MKRVVKVGLVAAGVAAGVAAARLYRATHPADARWLDQPDIGRMRPPPPDALFDLPDDVTHHSFPTPDGGTIHAVERGSGRPLVLLHGVTLRSDVWAPQFHQLADRYRVIAVDLRGHGISTAGDAGYGITRLADDLATLLETMDLREAILVGHSMGGMTVMQFCGQHPEVLAERVAGIAFVATRAHAVFPPLVGPGVRRALGRGESMLADGRDLPARATVNDRLARLAFGERPSPKAVHLVGEMGRSMAPQALIPSVSGLAEHDARVALRATWTPSVVVVGTRDLLTPVPAGRHLAHLLPDCELVVLPKAGHQIMQERPDELGSIIDDLVGRIQGAPSVAT